MGGLVDIITGLFSFDAKSKRRIRFITWRYGRMGTTFIIDLAVNFVKDLFGLNDDDNDEHLDLKILFGEDGIIQKALTSKRYIHN